MKASRTKPARPRSNKRRRRRDAPGATISLGEPERISLLQPVHATSVSDRIVEQVRAALFRGALKPGDFLGAEIDIARQMGVSRVPVREAFRSLQAMGIIEVRVGAHGGARVSVGNPYRFSESLAVQFKLAGVTAGELFDCQIAIESAAAELAAARATDQDLGDLEAILADLEQNLDDPRHFTWLALTFHRRIVEASHNRALIAHSHALIEVLYEAYEPQTTRALAEEVLAKHTRLFTHIRKGDGGKARDAITRHLRQVRDDVVSRQSAGRPSLSAAASERWSVKLGHPNRRRGP